MSDYENNAPAPNFQKKEIHFNGTIEGSTLLFYNTLLTIIIWRNSNFLNNA